MATKYYDQAVADVQRIEETYPDNYPARAGAFSFDLKWYASVADVERDSRLALEQDPERWVRQYFRLAALGAVLPMVRSH